ncbi:unnamed protein product [Prunus armeniaca]|uniref:PB1 domain-containing protein n=1 Tax=Prunus armeniaca TaxID=36596 RepID=A0A6J5XG57_PRUAR|nr:unnamed protein product [Prunus armeniaca]
MRSPFFPSSNLSITFAFKVEDKMSLMHRFTFYVQSLTYLMTAIIQRMGGDIDCNNLPQKLYEDDDCDKVILALDEDLVIAADLAKHLSWKVFVQAYIQHTLTKDINSIAN